MTDRMSQIDAWFIYAEDDGLNHMHIASILILEGPPPSYEQLLAMVASKIPNLPRYRQVMKQVPLQLGRPIWVDDPHFDLEYHVRQTALPSPGNQEQRWRMFSRIMNQRLDRTRPLWELWAVEGLEGGRWMLVNKPHHAMVDGVAGTELITNLLDLSPDPERPAPPDWSASPAPSSISMVASALTDLGRRPLEEIPGLVKRAWSLGRLPHVVSDEVQLARRMAAVKTATTLNGRVGPNRRFASTTATLAEVKKIRQTLGGTINDIVLAAVTRGFRDLLVARGEPLDGRVVRVLVPVALHERDTKGMAVHAHDGTYENKATIVVVDLPVSVDDPLERARDVRQQMVHIKASGEVATAYAITQLSGYAPATLLAAGMRAMAALPPQTNVNSVVSNVPGPQVPLYAAGRRVLEAYPCPPLFPPGAQIAVALWSYAGTLHFGMLGDYTTTADLDLLAHAIRRGFDELDDLAAGRAASRER